MAGNCATQGAMRLAAMQKDRQFAMVIWVTIIVKMNPCQPLCASNTVHQKLTVLSIKLLKFYSTKFQTTRAAFGTQRIPNCTPVSERQQATQHKYDVKFLILLDKLLRHDVDMVFPHSILATTSKSQGSHQNNIVLAVLRIINPETNPYIKSIGAKAQ